MHPVGFEPTPSKRLRLECSALDHSATDANRRLSRRALGPHETTISCKISRSILSPPRISLPRLFFFLTFRSYRSRQRWFAARDSRYDSDRAKPCRGTYSFRARSAAEIDRGSLNSTAALSHPTTSHRRRTLSIVIVIASGICFRGGAVADAASVTEQRSRARWSRSDSS